MRRKRQFRIEPETKIEDNMRMLLQYIFPTTTFPKQIQLRQEGVIKSVEMCISVK